jgi:hypothetical protein
MYYNLICTPICTKFYSCKKWVLHNVRKHTPKRVPECLRLRNHIIFVTIFSSIDLKKRLGRRDTDEMFQISTA